MPHYADGTPAKHGDLIHWVPAWDSGSEVLGILTSIMPQSDTCNGNILPLVARQKGSDQWFPTSGTGWSVTLKECQKVVLGALGAPKAEANEAAVA